MAWERAVADSVREVLRHSPGETGTLASLLRTKAGDGVRFHPVRVRLGDAPSAEAAKIELVLAGDRCIRLPPGFDAEDLRRLLTVVGVTV